MSEIYSEEWVDKANDNYYQMVARNIIRRFKFPESLDGIINNVYYDDPSDFYGSVLREVEYAFLELDGVVEEEVKERFVNFINYMYDEDFKIEEF